MRKYAALQAALIVLPMVLFAQETEPPNIQTSDLENGLYFIAGAGGNVAA